MCMYLEIICAQVLLEACEKLPSEAQTAAWNNSGLAAVERRVFEETMLLFAVSDASSSQWMSLVPFRSEQVPPIRAPELLGNLWTTVQMGRCVSWVEGKHSVCDGERELCGEEGRHSWYLFMLLFVFQTHPALGIFSSTLCPLPFWQPGMFS